MWVGKERRKNGKGGLMGTKLKNRALFKWLTTICSSQLLVVPAPEPLGAHKLTQAHTHTKINQSLKDTTERIKRQATENEPYLQSKYIIRLITNKI